MRSPEELREDKSVFMNQGEWELLHILSNYKIFSVDNDDYYAEMKFHVSILRTAARPHSDCSDVSSSQVVIRRRPLFYTVNLLLPSIFLMVMDIVGFYLPPDSGERVSFKITLLLGYSVFLIIVSDTLPATAIGTPLIGDRFTAYQHFVTRTRRLSFNVLLHQSPATGGEEPGLKPAASLHVPLRPYNPSEVF